MASKRPDQLMDLIATAKSYNSNFDNCSYRRHQRAHGGHFELWTGCTRLCKTSHIKFCHEIKCASFPHSSNTTTACAIISCFWLHLELCERNTQNQNKISLISHLWSLFVQKKMFALFWEKKPWNKMVLLSSVSDALTSVFWSLESKPWIPHVLHPLSLVHR